MLDHYETIKNGASNLIKLGQKQLLVRATVGDLFVPEVLDFVLNQPVRVQHIIAVQRLKTLELLKQVFTRMHLDHVGIQGETSSGMRQDAFAAFESGMIPILIGSAPIITCGWMTHRTDVCVSSTFSMFEDEAVQLVGRVRPADQYPNTDVEYHVRTRIFLKPSHLARS